MKIKLFLSAVLLLTFHISHAQSWEWAKNLSYGSQGSASGVGTDNQGNIYMTGGELWKFNSSGTILLEDTLEVNGISVFDSIGNIYVDAGDKIAKYNSAGNQLWVVAPPIGIISGIAIHPFGGVVIVGKTISDSSKSIFSRYDQNGNLLWTKIGDFFPGGTNLQCDNLGNTYIAGSGPKDSASGNCGFLVKYTNLGSLLYNKIIPSTVNSMAIDNNNNLYVGGWFSLLPINILGNIYSSTPSSPVPQFLIKYDSTGDVLWYKIITGNHGTGGIATDKSGNIYLTSNYTTLTIDNINLNAPYPNSTNLFIMKADSLGTILWYKNSVANIAGAFVGASAICVSNAGDVLMAGKMTKINTFGSYTLTQTSIYSDLLIAKIEQGISTNMAPPKPKSVKEFNVYPNPGQGMFQISCKASETKDIQINVFNNSGMKVYSEKTTNPQKDFTKNINLSKEAKGTYYIELITEGKKSVKKVILN